jgi:hypothetical protein
MIRLNTEAVTGSIRKPKVVSLQIRNRLQQGLLTGNDSQHPSVTLLIEISCGGKSENTSLRANDQT